MSLKTIFTLVVFTFCFKAHAENVTIRICNLDTGFPPFTNTKGTGKWQTLIKKTFSNLNLTAHFQYIPRERCLLKMRRGDIDAIFAAPSDKRASYMAFPKLKNGKHDANKAVDILVFRVYKKKNNPLDWDGKKFENLNDKTIGAQKGFNTIDDLNNLNVKTDGDLVATAEQNIMKLNLNRIIAAVVEETQGDQIIKEKGLNELVKLPIVFGSATVYLAFSQSFYARNTELAEKIWNNIQTPKKKLLRESRH
ncbi:hypothetical protein DOM21_06955 [Bacteriovorax stolpii]|uniref:Uncharacterized protein n=1 Tax=Bacteriovorax stolpii TaxID=960 RepID=A0A2K9NTI9_BACTC|nr:transporter substrate-binding domain-containing protein [Bacteriovorax stolpii]AUN98808.1 hypothetical protein C0V70_11990 [Bacteriovorax stolpii]QDK41197.1 hypothetical protein DOM21_06955 [Bacteriovorax stolpii]TDP55674.1 ABC-type amino acid transport substrate-binding protein [Bacteriovorax stolpii]